MAEKHFYEQKEFTKKYLLPYFKNYVDNLPNLKVLEVGCAEGGLLEELITEGIYAIGIEIDEKRVKIANSKNPSLKILVGDITDPQLPEKIFTELGLSEGFDFIIMREVIEHIKSKNAAFNNLNLLLKQNGYLFISFPPKYSPFAGHQQIGRSFLKIIPYLHLLPKTLLLPLAKFLGENEGYIDEIKHHYSTGCTIKEFENLVSQYNFQTIRKDLFLFRPIYSIRYGLPIIKLPDLLFVREFISFGCEVLLKK